MNKNKVSLIFIVLFILVLLSLPANEKHISNKVRKDIINTCIKAFKTYYIDPELSDKMEIWISKKLKAGGYDAITTLKDLTKQLRHDLREISGDGHIWVDIMANILPTEESITPEQIANKGKTNFGFEKIEILTGNIGYLRLRSFQDPEYAGDTAIAAMNFLANTDALIIDLRSNHGGNGKMVHLISSYLFKNKTQLNSLYFREADILIQAWTFGYVPGKKLNDQALYILTNDQTTSAAESFSYTMKHNQRASIVGGRTKGAAHWKETYTFADLGFFCEIPVARPINPVTKSDWEGTGIKPDIVVDEKKAFDVAYLKALENLIQKTESLKERYLLNWVLIIQQGKINPIVIDNEGFKEYTGLYDEGQYSIRINNNGLIWKLAQNKEYKLFPLIKDIFGFEDGDDYRLKFLRDEQGNVKGFQLLNKNSMGDPPIRLKKD